jgi:hypothetical protein
LCSTQSVNSVIGRILVNQAKNIIAKKYRTEVLKPSTDLICYTLYTMSIDETKKRFSGKWCLVVGMYILTILYVYKLLRPLEVRFKKSIADTLPPPRPRNSTTSRLTPQYPQLTLTACKTRFTHFQMVSLKW